MKIKTIDNLYKSKITAPLKRIENKKKQNKNTLLYKCYHSTDFLLKVVEYSLFAEQDKDPTDDELIASGYFKNKRAIRNFEKTILSLNDLKGV